MSLINSHHSKSFGFTLIELLVVIFIISIVAGTAVLSIGHNQKNKLQAFTKQVTETLLLARQQAMLQPVVIGVYLSGYNIQFYDLQSQTKAHRNKWQARQDKLLSKLEVPDDLQIKLANASEQSEQSEQDEKKKINPQIVISSNGDLTPFVLYVGLQDEKSRFVIRGDIDGSIAWSDTH